ncbi:MAG: sodium:solute symporter, partial [Cyanobacteria bacterium K_DeepCast_150m_m2_101]|nr:sodium:solute symporter [Cyanobacteria bacterium K_DeepCast_150m_m2_101]
MNDLLPNPWNFEALLGLEWLALAAGVLSLILMAGRRIGRRLNLRLWGVPEALVAGLIGL